MISEIVDGYILGTDRRGASVRVGDFRSWGFWVFLRLAQPTALGTALSRFLEEPTDDELHHAAYAEVKPESVAEIKRNALASGLDPAAVLAREFSLLDDDDNRRARDGIFDARQGRT